MSDETPRVWVGCLACYNAGHLVGQWVDAIDAAEFVPCTKTEFGAQHEEFWCMDHEGFEGFLTGECSPMEAQAIAEAIDAIPDYVPVAAVAAYLSNMGEGIGELDMSDFEESYCGEYSSEGDYAQELADDCGQQFYTKGRYGSPEKIDPTDVWPFSCIDWERAARELFMGDNWSAPTSNYGVYVFRRI